ncbi:MAG: [FeFe] hydrogenase H-cluster maturation GTPase HydF [Coriobacteriia bacterium]|nr:[FeFe] hydrogenase H-cluster maturation GTPase HydF [Coriobacteriia bacterium]
MSLNDTPSSERVHIGFFGLRNAGKSSLVNAVTGQDLSVVSEVRGTTTDAVTKAMEILPIGPCVVLDTPGIDDEGGLGALRVEAARKALRKCDVAVLVSEAGRPLAPAETQLLDEFQGRSLPWLVARTKGDLLEGEDGVEGVDAARTLVVSAVTGEGVYQLKELIARVASTARREKPLMADLVQRGDTVVSVIPIDSAAPKMRIILPQQMVLRDCLDHGVSCLCCQPSELADCLANLKKPPRLVVTDSQAFAEVSAVVPKDVLLTGFSILMARYKGELDVFARGAGVLAQLTDESRVLVCEGCTHHRQCDDIGTVKIPAWVRAHSGANPQFEFTSGGGFPADVSPYDLVIHCGACMLNAREVAHRLDLCAAADVPVVNYGIAIAKMKGILDRALAPFA